MRESPRRSETRTCPLDYSSPEAATAIIEAADLILAARASSIDRLSRKITLYESSLGFAVIPALMARRIGACIAWLRALAVYGPASMRMQRKRRSRLASDAELAFPHILSEFVGNGRDEAHGGMRVCLIFEHSLSHYTRLRLELEALQNAGAHVRLVTSHPLPEDAPDTVEQISSPLNPPGMIGEARASWRPVRIIESFARNIARPILWRAGLRARAKKREQTLRALAPETDIFWVIDYPSLPTAVKVASATDTRLVYETCDLVPEFEYYGKRHRRRSLADERRLVGAVDAFITVCDSYADYYMERYGDRELDRYPFVRNDMPAVIVDTPRPTARPLRILFLGSLMTDRPVDELITAVAQTPADLRLTFQGKNYLGDAPARRIEELGLQDRIEILPPCPYDRTVDTAAAYDLGIVALRGSDENERRAETTKLYTYMASGLAIIGSNLPGIARVVRSNRNGLLVDSMRPEAWAKAFTDAAALPNDEIDAMKQRSVQAARLHAWDMQRPLFVAQFKRALLGASPAEALAAEVLREESGSASRRTRIYERTLGLAVIPVLARRALIVAQRHTVRRW